MLLTALSFYLYFCFFFFFFQAEDGIRDLTVTGVQTCALPISATAIARNAAAKSRLMLGTGEGRPGAGLVMRPLQIGDRAAAGQERRRGRRLLAGGSGAL